MSKSETTADEIEAKRRVDSRQRSAWAAVFVLDKVIALVQSDMPKDRALTWLAQERARWMTEHQGRTS